MFEAYPQQRISSSKIIAPLSLVAVLCLVLYAAFESSSHDERLESLEDPGMRRMRPFLSSRSFEIGLWTRSKGHEGHPSSSDAASAESAEEVAQLRQELEKARVRTEQQAAELSRLRPRSPARGSSAGERPVEDSEPDASKDAPKEAPEIPPSLWREPPEVSPAPTPSPRGEAPVPDVKEEIKDSTITVKTGDKQIILQIGKEPETSSTSQGWQGKGVETTTQASVVLANATESKGESDGTLITVRSGQQSIVIQVRDEQATASPSSTSSLELTNTTALAAVKALPELPELPPLAEEVVPNRESETFAGLAAEVDVSTTTEPEEEESTTTKGNPAYANLALRTR
ncbi:unnamed protein product [Durusdinium trenchii]|uniref:Uncharacterized protein n=1 Tax=Durusdinium trenchii TaxID=1381693 RepID=A0ABP0NP63_9DINO